MPLAIVQDGVRVMRICNACRYCEGFCAVFPALERRLDFSEPDLAFLANLCHDCGECYYSCQYAPPHEFNVNVPRLFAQIRRDTYRTYAWPGALGTLFDRNGLALALTLVGGPLFLVALLTLFGDAGRLVTAYAASEGSFYRVVPHTAMVVGFGALGLAVVAAMIGGVFRFWRDIGGSPIDFPGGASWKQAIADALTLRYLDGGGEGCAYPSEVPSQARRWFHHLTAYGFLLCFAATSVAAFYHNVLGWVAPYPVVSLPVILGCAGGAGLLAGPVGLLWLKFKRNPEAGDPAQAGLDATFLLMLFFTSLTGFLLLIFRETRGMGFLLAVHLGIVLGLFITLPYGKFVHAIYRFVALVHNAVEQRQPAPNALD